MTDLNTNEMDSIIESLFMARWVGEDTLSSLDNMKKQLHKNLTDQLNGYWSGHTAYSIMVDGGFLVDAPRGSEKRLTELGKRFMEHKKGEQRA